MLSKRLINTGGGATGPLDGREMMAARKDQDGRAVIDRSSDFGATWTSTTINSATNKTASAPVGFSSNSVDTTGIRSVATYRGLGQFYGGSVPSTLAISNPNYGYGTINNVNTGQYVLYFQDGGPVQKSSNYGANYSPISYTSYTTGFGMSYDGQYQYIFTVKSGVGLVYIKSTDYGATWTSDITTPYTSGGAVGVAVSEDGSRISINHSTGYVISTNYGSTWSLSSTNRPNYYGHIDMSADGQYQYATRRSALQRSTDYGATWSDLQFFTDITNNSVSCSYNGQYVLVADGYRLRISNNYGASFSTRTNGTNSYYGGVAVGKSAI